MSDDDRRDSVNDHEWSTSRERVALQLIHWSVVSLVVICTAVLAFNGTLDKLSIGTIYGTVIGHAGTSAAQKLSTRR